MTQALDPDAVPDYGSLLRLDGRRFVIIGAGQGIGRQAAHALAAVGARAFCVDVDPDRAAQVAGEVDGIAWTGDATRRDEAQRMFRAAGDQMAGLDGVVDIVGMARYQQLTDITDEDWDWHFDIVLRHTWYAMQYGGRMLADAGGGALVHVASISGLVGAPMHAAYGAAKAGLISLVRSAAVELGPRGVRVNAVAPGVVWTPRVSAYLGAEGHARNAANAPLDRVAMPSDIASAILYLASPLSSYVSGQTLVVDGGVSAKFPYPMPDMDAAPSGA